MEILIERPVGKEVSSPMASIPPISGATSTVGGSSARVAERAESVRTASPEDQVEISQLGQALSTIEPESHIRVDKVSAIRDAIKDGTYLTDDKLAVTVERLVSVLRESA